MINYDYFRLSLQRLQEQHDNYRQSHSSFPATTREAIAESIMVRFRKCYDCTWKVMRRYLTEVFGVADVPCAPKPVFRHAVQCGLLRDSLERWFKYAEWRVQISSQEATPNAEAGVAIAGEFIADAISVYGTMVGKPWPSVQ